MKNFTITLTAQCVVIVQAATEDEAGMIAMQETPLSAFNIETGDQISEIESISLDRHLAHADHVIRA